MTQRGHTAMPVGALRKEKGESSFGLFLCSGTPEFLWETLHIAVCVVLMPARDQVKTVVDVGAPKVTIL